MSVNFPTGAFEETLATEIAGHSVAEYLVLGGAILGVFVAGRWLLRKAFGTNAVHAQSIASRARYASVFPMAA